MNQQYPVSTPIELSTTLRALRRANGLSQEEVGQLLGVNQKRIAWIESVPGRTSFDQISRLVTALGGRVVIDVTAMEDSKASIPVESKSPSQW